MIPLLALYLEDSPHDVELVQELLRDSGYDLNMDIVTKENDFIQLLKQRQFDIIFSDYNLPGFNGMAALNIAMNICPDIPFICISGEISEEVAVNMLKNGAIDFLMKDRIKRLPFAASEAIEKKKVEQEKKAAYRELLDSEKRYRSLFDGVPIGLYRVDPTFKILDINTAAKSILGYNNTEELIGYNFTDFLLDSEFRYNLINKANTDNVFDEEIQMFRSNKQIIFVNIKGRIVRDDNEEIILIEGSFEDITQKKETENEIRYLNAELENRVIERTAELQEAMNKLQVSNNELKILNEQVFSDSKKILELNDSLINSENELKEVIKTKDKFFSIIAHDLKDPFTGFMGMTDLMVKNAEALTIEEIKMMSEAVNKSANSLFKLIEDLFQWSRSQAGSITYLPDKYDLFMIGFNTIFSMMHAADNKSIELIQNFEKNSFVFCDINMINTVFRNLISNAIKYCKINGRIETGIISSSNYFKNSYTIYIKDNGIGIREDLQKNLFRIDIRLTTKGTLGEQGTGLGLILCKEFIEKHGGSIWVESNEGSGTTFYFTLPKHIE